MIYLCRFFLLALFRLLSFVLFLLFVFAAVGELTLWKTRKEELMTEWVNLCQEMCLCTRHTTREREKDRLLFSWQMINLSHIFTEHIKRTEQQSKHFILSQFVGFFSVLFFPFCCIFLLTKRTGLLWWCFQWPSNGGYFSFSKNISSLINRSVSRPHFFLLNARLVIPNKFDLSSVNCGDCQMREINVSDADTRTIDWNISFVIIA